MVTTLISHVEWLVVQLREAQTECEYLRGEVASTNKIRCREDLDLHCRNISILELPNEMPR